MTCFQANVICFFIMAVFFEKKHRIFLDNKENVVSLRSQLTKGACLIIQK